jgi:NDP-sugar pyrophosphorylase family protein
MKKAIILAGGRGTRMLHLTSDKPKPMLCVRGVPIIHHIIAALPAEIKEIILVVGYKGGVIRDYCKNELEGRSIRYVEQEEQQGTAHALHLCRAHINTKESFLFHYADDFHSIESIKTLCKSDNAMLVAHHSNPSRFGVVVTDEKGYVKEIEEKPKTPKTNIVSTGVYKLDDTIFKYPLIKDKSGEYFIPPLIEKLITEKNIQTVTSNFWHPIGYPKDIERAEKELANHNLLYTKNIIGHLS